MVQVCPYEILGVSPNASMEDVRVAYLRAARTHHPDKLAHLSVDERVAHESIFKNCTDAYSRIVEARASGKTGATADEFVRAWKPPTRPDEWEAIWQGVEHMFSKHEVLNTVKDLFMKATKLKREWANTKANTEAASDTASDTTEVSIQATLIVTPQDVQTGKKRHVRVMRDSGDLHIVVDCGVFPNAYVEGDVEIKMVIDHEDAAEYEEGIWDLFRTVNINLLEWFTGKRIEVNPLVVRGPPLFVVLPPCVDVELPICIENAAYWKFGPIYITIHLDLPKIKTWENIKSDNQEKFLEVLRDVV